MSYRLLIGALLALTLTLAAQKNDSADVMLGSALHQEEVEDNCMEAIKSYEKVIQQKGVSRNTAARAQLHIGSCREKLGLRDARAAYELVLSRYADQPEVTAAARARIGVLSAPTYKGLTKLSMNGYAASYWESVTPDGRYLEFLGHAQGGLVLHDIATGEEKKIAVGGGVYNSNGVLSPDTKSVALMGITGRSAAAAWDVFVSPVSGGAATKALLNNKEFVFGRPFGWSPDSKDIFALLARKDQTWVIAKLSAANGTIQVIKSLEWRVPYGLSVSPDGRFVAYDAPVARESPQDHDIFLLAVDGRSEIRVAQDPALDEMPVWTTDGKAIVFTSGRLGDQSLFSITLNDDKPQLLRKNIGQHEPMGFTRDGSYFYKTGGSSFSLTSAPIDWDAGTISTEKTIGHRPGSLPGFAYSPDGQKLAYLPAERVYGFTSIVVRSKDGQSEIQTLLKQGRDLSWLPDGQSVMFSAQDITEGNGIHRIDLKSGEDLIKDRLEGRFPVPSPDGKTVYYLKKGNTLTAYDFETKQETELLRNLAFSPFAVSPDGREVAFTLYEEREPTPGPGAQTNALTLAVASTAGGPIRKLPSPQGQGFRIIQWSADGKNVLAQTFDGAAIQLWRVPADGAEPRKGPSVANAVVRTTVSLLPDGKETVLNTPATISLHPDGKEIVLSKPIAAPAEELWVDPDLLRSATPPNAERPEDGIYEAGLNPTTGRISGPAELIIPSPDVSCPPAWSPDGKAVLFVRSLGRIILRATDTGVERTIQSPPLTCPAAWFHDGHSVLVWPRKGTAGSAGQSARLDLNTGKFQDINISVPGDAMALSTDDKTLFLTVFDEKSKITSVESVDLATRKQKRVWASPYPTETDAFVDRKLALSPDGQTLALVVWDSKAAQLIRVGTDGAGYLVLYSAAKPASQSGNPELSPGGLSWTPDGRALLFMERDKTNHLRVMRILSDGGKPEPMGLEIENTTAIGKNWHTVSDFFVSPDGRRIAFWSPRRPGITNAGSRVN